MVQFVMAHKLEILGFLLGLSEALAYIPQVKANSIFQAIVSGVKKLKALVAPEPKAE